MFRNVAILAPPDLIGIVTAANRSATSRFRSWAIGKMRAIVCAPVQHSQRRYCVSMMQPEKVFGYPP
jgi:hypothetical protein